ncbi:hypothetical protein [Streptomyces sp. NPDC055189]
MAMASLAYDFGFPVALSHPYLPTRLPPTSLLDRERIEEMPA